MRGLVPQDAQSSLQGGFAASRGSNAPVRARQIERHDRRCYLQAHGPVESMRVASERAWRKMPAR